ncbi:MAG: hypothetical protein NTV52_23155 [Acidobacteria bacterium]|nr:hypothetical protein [Acidobacteriota bacterium]
MRSLFSLLVLFSALLPAQNAVQVSNYLFQGNLNPQRGGSAVLTATNPSGNSGFVTDTVFGQARTVYAVAGAASPRAAQGGLTYQAKDKVPRDNYSMEFVLAFNAGSTGWRRIFDCQNLTRSEGLYLDPSGFITYHSGVSSSAENRLVAGTYYHVVLVKRPGEVLVYLNGRLVASRNPTDLGVMAAALNPDQLVRLFLDDDNEWAPARIALFRVYAGPLSATEVRDIYAAPFTSTVGLPRPGFQSSGIVNSASYSAANAITPGGFFSIFGSDLGDDFGDWGQSFVNNVAPRRLNNVRVLVNDQEAFIAFTSSGQINAIAPDNLPDGPVNVVVEYSTLRSTTVATQSRRINPAVFRFTPENSRYLASTANDGSAYIGPPNLFGTNGSLNGLALRPARPGEYVVLYGTGLGPTTPPVPAGQIPPARSGGYPLSNASEIRLTLNGQTTSVVPAYSGLSGFPGLHQLVFLVPDIPNGDYETVLVVNGLSSPTGTYLPLSK